MTTPRLETRQLALGYDGATFATGIDLVLAPAEIVAILGPSGSGKSTLLATIAGVVPEVTGRVLVDGIDLRDVREESLRSEMGIVPQEGHLFSGTIADNVRFAHPLASDDDVRRALDAVVIVLAVIVVREYLAIRGDSNDGGAREGELD